MFSSGTFNDKLYLGGGLAEPSPNDAVILEYDGETFEVVFRKEGGLGGGRGAVEALGEWNNHLYAARRPQDGYGEIYRSSDGSTWNKVYDTGNPRGIYQFIPYGGDLYAFEGEPSATPSRIYSTSNGTDWSLYKSVGDVSWFRSHVPADRITLDLPFIGAGDGQFYTFDGDLHRFAKFPKSRQPGQVALKAKRIGGAMFLIVGVGTGRENIGEMWMWDGEKFENVVRTPCPILDAEYFLGDLYIATSGTAWSDQNAIQSQVYKLSPGIIKESKARPFGSPLIENETVGTGGTTRGRIPALGYDKSIFRVYADQSGTLNVEMYDSLAGAWRTYDSMSTSANTLETYSVLYPDKLMRITYTPDAQASVSAWVECQ